MCEVTKEEGEPLFEEMKNYKAPENDGIIVESVNCRGKKNPSKVNQLIYQKQNTRTMDEHFLFDSAILVLGNNGLRCEEILRYYNFLPTGVPPDVMETNRQVTLQWNLSVYGTYDIKQKDSRDRQTDNFILIKKFIFFF